jgi:hypothetical protein
LRRSKGDVCLKKDQKKALTQFGKSCINSQVNRESQSLENMKMKKLVTTAALLVAIATAAAPSALALTVAEAKAAKKAVTSVPAPEMPAKAAELVVKADKADRKHMAVTVVQAAISKNRSVAPAVVSAVIKAAPDTAKEVTWAAAQFDAVNTPAIVNVASTTAPQQAREVRQVLQPTTSRVTAVPANDLPSTRPRVSAAEPAPTGTVSYSNTQIDGTPFEGPINPAPQPVEVDYTQPREF